MEVGYGQETKPKQFNMNHTAVLGTGVVPWRLWGSEDNAGLAVWEPGSECQLYGEQLDFGHDL